MRIYYENPALRHIRVDREHLVAFLHDQGMSDQDIKQLCIRFRDQVPQGYSSDFPAEKILGSYNNSCSVYVCTRNREHKVMELNRTLLHELRHYMKNGYQPGEENITYWERPSEVDARVFAEQHYKAHVFLYRVGLPDEPATSTKSTDVPTSTPTRVGIPLLLTVAVCALILKHYFLRNGGEA